MLPNCSNWAQYLVAPGVCCCYDYRIVTPGRIFAIELLGLGVLQPIPSACLTQAPLHIWVAQALLHSRLPFPSCCLTGLMPLWVSRPGLQFWFYGLRAGQPWAGHSLPPWEVEGRRAFLLCEASFAVPAWQSSLGAGSYTHVCLVTCQLRCRAKAVLSCLPSLLTPCSCRRVL